MGTPQLTICVLGQPANPCAYEHVAARVPKGRSGDRANRLCPCHDDRDASLSINPGTEGMRVVWCCQAGCPADEVRAALLDLGADESCLGRYGLPKRAVVPGLRVGGADPALVADAKRWQALLKLDPHLNPKLDRMCRQAIAEGDGDVPGDPDRLLPRNKDEFVDLAMRAGIERTYRYKLWDVDQVRRSREAA